MEATAADEWRTVPKRRGRRPRPAKLHMADGDPEMGGDGDAVRRRVCEAREDLVTSDFWRLTEELIQKCFTKPKDQLQESPEPISEVLEHLCLEPSQHPVEAPNSNLRKESLERTSHFKCVCYGIGKFASCVIARNQLAFLLLFLEKLQIPRNHCYIFDPLFNELEISVLNAFGLTVLNENEEGKRNICGEPTIFYMIHCGTALYNNLLWSNWSVDSLSKVMIIGNSFKGIEAKLLTRILQENYPYVAKILKGIEEIEFPQTSQYMDVFNDTAILWFPLQNLKEFPSEMWTFQDGPVYSESEELEIIRNKRKLTQPFLQ
ncbi:SRR1-like protein isoform X2 [Monodelphis domestica]|uniref:SRR1-like protein isoform X2 n=1 Tax=Monodelphis domestica TaxID=13616 RepID=UPI0024E1A4BD|nr:SRR1-like protein isoform X2 [Monodelphis domestica]